MHAEEDAAVSALGSQTGLFPPAAAAAPAPTSLPSALEVLRDWRSLRDVSLEAGSVGEDTPAASARGAREWMQRQQSLPAGALQRGEVSDPFAPGRTVEQVRGDETDVMREFNERNVFHGETKTGTHWE